MAQPARVALVAAVVLAVAFGGADAAMPSLSDVASWATAFGNSMVDLGDNGLGVTQLQEIYDNQAYSSQQQNVTHIFLNLQSQMATKLQDRIKALEALRDSVQSGYANANSGSTTYSECCATTSGFEYNQAFLAEVNMGATCERFPAGKKSDDDADLKASSGFLSVAKDNRQKYPAMKWQYYGSQTGMYRIFPSKNRDSCTDYDPRYRPWYVASATPKPKDIVLVIDSSGSMGVTFGGKTRMELAKQASIVVLDTLNPNDYVNVVEFDTSARVYTGSKAPNCMETSMALGDARNRAFLKTFINNDVAEGGSTYYVKALTKAFSLLNQGKQDGNTGGGDRAVIFLTDGEPQETRNDIMNYINANHGDIKLLTFSFGSQSTIGADAIKLLEDMASATGGQYVHVPDGGDLRSAMGNYYDFFSIPNPNQPAIWTTPYFDASGLGLIVTAALPVYHSNALKGVVGVDVTMDDLVADVSYFNAGEFSFAFIIDDHGRVMMHPMLPLPGLTSNDPTFVDLSVLESDAQFIAKVRDPMMRGEAGQVTLTLKRALSRGDVRLEGVKTVSKDFTIMFGNVTGSPLRFGVAIASTDMTRREISSTATTKDVVYHRVDIDPDANCNHLGTVASIKTTCVKLSPESFQDPAQYLGTAETAAMVQRWNEWISGDAGTPPSIFEVKDEDQLRRDLLAANGLSSSWTGTSDIVDFTAWRYVGTRSGLFVKFPASPMQAHYDPTIRPWFQRAVATKGTYTISTPYEDASGAGTVLTLSRAVYEGTANKQHNDKEAPYQAVLGVDFTLGLFWSKVQEHTGCSDSLKTGSGAKVICFIMDDSGFIVWHPDFVDGKVPAAEQSSYFVSQMYPRLGASLNDPSQPVLSEHRCNAYEDLHSLLFYTSETRKLDNIHATVKGCSSSEFSIAAVAGTNVYLVVVSDSSCLYDSGVCECNQDIYSSTNRNDCQCPGPSELTYDSCAGSFNLGADANNPTCPPAPLARSSLEVKTDASSLSKCYAVSCEDASTFSDCFGRLGCSWCEFDSQGRELPPADWHCSSEECPVANPLACPIGSASATPPCDSAATLVGVSVTLLVVAVLSVLAALAM